LRACCSRKGEERGPWVPRVLRSDLREQEEYWKMVVKKEGK
jgi:hypothetical protein